jgi:hypothetical protein
MDRRSALTRPGRPDLRALGATALLATALVAGPTAAQDPSPSLGPDGSPAPTLPRPLEPGRHSWSDLGVELSLEVDAGWTAAPPLDGPLIVLERADMPGGVLSLTRFDGDTFADSCDPSSLTWVEPSAQRLIEIIGGNPFLAADPPAFVEIDGYSGVSLDAATPPYAPEECRLALLLLWAIPMKDGEFVQVQGQESRFIVLDVGADTIVIAIETLPGVEFEPFAEAAMDLVSSLTFEPG